MPLVLDVDTIKSKLERKVLPLSLVWHMSTQGHEKWAVMGTVYTNEWWEISGQNCGIVRRRKIWLEIKALRIKGEHKCGQAFYILAERGSQNIPGEN